MEMSKVCMCEFESFNNEKSLVAEFSGFVSADSELWFPNSQDVSMSRTHFPTGTNAVSSIRCRESHIAARS